MFTNAQRQVERTGRSGTPRDKYLQVGPVPPPPSLPSFIVQGLVIAGPLAGIHPANPFPVD